MHANVAFPVWGENRQSCCFFVVHAYPLQKFSKQALMGRGDEWVSERERGIWLGMLGQYVTVVTTWFPWTRTFYHEFMLHVLVSVMLLAAGNFPLAGVWMIFFLFCTVIISLRYIIIPGSTRKIYIPSYLKIFFLDFFYKFKICISSKIFFNFFSEKNEI